jgi:hypothetical protein
MPTTTPFAHFLNAHFATPVDALLRAFHVQGYDPAAPINDTFAMELLVFAALLLFFIIVRISLDVEKPNPVQHLAEGIHGFVSEQSESIVGHGSERYISFVTIVALFILLCNLLGLIPGLKSPTADKVVPCGCAILTFLYYHYQGVRARGVADASARDHLPLCPAALAHGPSVGKHLRRRPGDAGVLLADPGAVSAHLYQPPHYGVFRSGVPVHGSGVELSLAGRGGRPLISRL